MRAKICCCSHAIHTIIKKAFRVVLFFLQYRLGQAEGWEPEESDRLRFFDAESCRSVTRSGRHVRTYGEELHWISTSIIERSLFWVCREHTPAISCLRPRVLIGSTPPCFRVMTIL